MLLMKLADYTENKFNKGNGMSFPLEVSSNHRGICGQQCLIINITP